MRSFVWRIIKAQSLRERAASVLVEIVHIFRAFMFQAVRFSFTESLYSSPRGRHCYHLHCIEEEIGVQRESVIHTVSKW